MLSSNAASHAASQTGLHGAKAIKIAGKGTGLVATKDLARGSVVLPWEAPTLSVPLNPKHNSAAQWNAVWTAFWALPATTKARIRALCVPSGTSPTPPSRTPQTEIRTNSFIDVLPDGSETVQLFVDISQFNHSCTPNISIRDSRNRHCRAVTIAPHMAVGTELSISYLGPEVLLEPRHTRQAQLSEAWGFECACSACTVNYVKSDERRAIILQFFNAQHIDSSSLMQVRGSCYSSSSQGLMF